MSEAELVKAVLAGRTERFEALVTRYTGLARGVCASHVRDDAVLDDLVQESFVYAYTKLGTLRDGNRFGPWLCAIVRNKCRDWLRRNRRERDAELALASEPTADVATPEDALTGEELRDWVRTHIARLPERTREAMFLCYVDGLDQKDAAIFLGISLSALKKRLQYGREQISHRIWRQLDGTERPKRDDAKLAGAVMMAVQSVKPPVVAVGGLGAISRLGLKTRVVAAGAAIVSIAGVYVMFPAQLNTPALDAPVATVELSNSESDVDSLSVSPTVPPTAPPVRQEVSRVRPELTASPVAQEKRGISGLVIMEDTKKPVEGVEVQLLMPTERLGIHPSDIYTTGPEGTFAFSEVDPETEFSLRLGWPYRYAADYPSRSFGRGPQPTHYVIEARAVGAITGYVRNSDGEPVQDATVMRTFPFGNTANQLATTGINGRFGFSHDGGIWRLQAKGRMGLNSELAVFDLAQGESLEHEFTLPSSAAIHLTITTPEGTPPGEIRELEVERVYPELLESGNPKVMKSYSGGASLIQDGELFTLPLLGEGSYTITMTAPGFSEAVVGPLVIDASLTDQYAAVVLEKEPVSETVTAEGAANGPDEKIRFNVSAQDGLGNPLQAGSTFVCAIDEMGQLHNNSTNLAPGMYWMAAIKEGYGADIRYQVVSKESSDLTFTLAEGGTIYGTVPQPSEKKLTVFPLEIWESIGKPVGSLKLPRGFRTLGTALAQGTLVDDDNAFTLPGLPDGWYVVMTNQRVSEPVEVRTGHMTGPVHLAPEPVNTVE